MPRAFLAALLLAFALPAAAGKYNDVLSIGDAGPAWENLPGTDGKTHSSSDFKDAAVLVVAFTCNTCPYARDHEQRLVAFAKKYEGQPVRLVAINCNAGDGDSLDAMKARAKEKGFEFPYLKDAAGATGKAFGASHTPEFVVLGPERKVAYLGSFDDSPKGTDVKHRYVEEAVRSLLDGVRPGVTETPLIGCAVKYPKERRRPRPAAGSGT